MMYHALAGFRGLGQDDSGGLVIDGAGDDGSNNANGVSVTSTNTGGDIYGTAGAPTSVPVASNPITSLLTGAPTGSPSAGFNWGTFLSSLVGTAGAVTSNVLTSSTTTQQAQAQSAAQIAAAQASAAQSSTLMTLGLVGVAGVVLVLMFSGGKR